MQMVQGLGFYRLVQAHLLLSPQDAPANTSELGISYNIASLSMGDESWNRKGCLRLLRRFVESGRKLRDGGLLEKQIKAAEKDNDHDLLLKLLSKKQKMAERSEKQKMAILNEN